MMVSYKHCSRCKLEKSTKDFCKNAKTLDGLQSRCKECAKKHRQENAETWKRYNVKAKSLAKYGELPDTLHKMLEQQKGVCAICRKALSFYAAEKRDKPHIDHDHITGRVRGLLCITCNTGLGMFSDNVETMRLAVDYILSSVQADRLSEPAPLTEDDATVGSQENKNLEKLAEISNSLP